MPLTSECRMKRVFRNGMACWLGEFHVTIRVAFLSDLVGFKLLYTNSSVEVFGSCVPRMVIVESARNL